jgi:amidase
MRRNPRGVIGTRIGLYGRIMNFDEYRRYDATGLAKLVADKEVTAAGLLTLAQERAAAVNPRINAIVRDVPASPADHSGPFAGVPFLIKDIAQDYAGLPTSQGSRSLMSMLVAEHATVVRRWIDAGLVIFGKTNLPEFGAKALRPPNKPAQQCSRSPTTSSRWRRSARRRTIRSWRATRP